MGVLAHSQSPLLNPDRNPILRWFLKKTFYAQFCAGENAKEVQKTVRSLKNMRFKGVMLCYAKEVVLDEKASSALESGGDSAASKLLVDREILPWKKGTMETVAMTQPGDFVAVKYEVQQPVSRMFTNNYRFTGAGSRALYDLSRNNKPSPALEEAITAICDLAASRGVRLAFDAEQQALQTGIFSWTVDYMRKYNKSNPRHAVVYCTYQAYLKAAPKILAEHLSIARKEGFTLGIKLVRGAYLASDPRYLIHDTKAETDLCYDGMAESVIRRQYGTILQPATEEADRTFPSVNLVLACHNLESVRKAEAIRKHQELRGEPRIDMIHAQLQGMADEVSCELLLAAKRDDVPGKDFEVPQAYKYLVWGTTGECMKYLLRRAQENKDAVQRTREGRNAMIGELLRRAKSWLKIGALTALIGAR
jgi:proline dehydrogenase